MAVDLSVFDKQKTVLDQQQLQEAFNLKKAAILADLTKERSGSSLPAPIQLANEFQKARMAGDTQRMSDIAGFAKIYDRGVMPSDNGMIQPIEGYAQAIGQIEQGKQTGKNMSDLAYKPAIAGSEQMAKANVDIQTKPIIEKATSVAGKVGAELGDRTALLNSMQANMPQLEQTVNKLSELGKGATYTYTGRAVNTLGREAGIGVGEGGVKRKEYISLVDNQILPLLRQTFGAQFTQKEGDSLKQTLGDPNATPEEKDAVLKSFIEQKKATIGSLQRETGYTPAQPVVLSTDPQPTDYKSKYGLK